MPGLITSEIPAKDVGLPKWAKDALKKSGLKEWKDASLIRKGITPEDTKFKESERSSVDYITTKAVDRDGDIVVPGGAVLDHYRNNPVVLFGHDYHSLPVGKSLWIKADDRGLISKTQYAKHKKAEDIYQYRKDGFPMAKSIGFIPITYVDKENFEELDLKSLDLKEEDLVGASRVYTKWLMLEYSDVPVPSNPEALQLAISKNIITEKEIKLASENKAFVFNIIDAEPEDKKMLKERYGKEIELMDEELSDSQKDVIEDIEVDTSTITDVLATVDDDGDAEKSSSSEDLPEVELIDEELTDEQKAVIEDLKLDEITFTGVYDPDDDIEKSSSSGDGPEHGPSISPKEDGKQDKSIVINIAFSDFEKILNETEKEGRVLSKKTRSLISDALDGMDKATSALNELIGEEDIKDGSEQDEEAVEDKVEEVVEEKQEDVIKIIEEKKEGVWNFSDEELKSAIADAITDVLRDQLKVDAGDIVKNRIDLAKGKVF